MTDRELLELAASAAGLYYWIDVGAFLTHGDTPGGSREWNPLTDDGDAFRLAVRLRLFVDVTAEASGAGCQSYAWRSEPHGDDQNAATRRAIVRAAAEIGRAMP